MVDQMAAKTSGDARFWLLPTNEAPKRRKPDRKEGDSHIGDTEMVERPSETQRHAWSDHIPFKTSLLVRSKES